MKGSPGYVEAPQSELPLKPAKPKRDPQRVLRRKDSRFWQARFIDHTGRLIQRTNGCTLHSSALQWLECAKADAARRRQTPNAPLS